MEKLRISSNGHYFETMSGEPFMWMGIVPWKMPEMADRSDVDYFITQIKKPEHKYNVIFTVVVMGRSCTNLNPPNAYGHRPFNGGDVPNFTSPRIISGGSPDNPNDFWDHLDYLVRECEANDIYLVLVPQWSNTYVHNRYKCNMTPMDAATARAYGEFLGNRYKNQNHIIWMMGGDGADPTERGTKDIYRAQAEGILKGYTGCTSCPSWNQPSALWDEVLMTYHGHISRYISNRVSQFWGPEDIWIDIDGCYNCHCRSGDWYGLITEGYDLSPHKPVIEVEGQGFWDVYDPIWGPVFEGTKAFPYMHYLLGGAGPSNLDQHWNFEPGWEHNLNLPERNWVGYMTGFMSDVWYKLIPDNSIVLSPPGTLWGEIVSARSSDNDLIMVSFSEEGSGTAQLDLSDLNSYSSVRATWLNISDGSTQDAGIHLPADTPWFTVPATWDGAVLKVEGIYYDPCEGVVCDNICIGNDLWSRKCVDGDCVPDKLIESNSSTCEYDPCDGVVCDNVCIGKDLWSQKCVGGSCVPDQLIESNSTTCGYDPCDGVVCENVCVGNNLYSQKCEDGSCVPDQLLETNSSLCDIVLCEGVVCSKVCVGYNLWSRRCIAGMCVSDQLLERDSVLCGYIPTDPCEDIVCENICISNNLFSQRCIDGTCFPYQLIEDNSELCKLCEGVVCGNTCVGNDLWSQRCDPDTGNCVPNQLLQQDSINCKIPDQIPSDESTINTYLILGGFGIMGLAMLILNKK